MLLMEHCRYRWGSCFTTRRKACFRALGITHNGIYASAASVRNASTKESLGAHAAHGALQVQAGLSMLHFEKQGLLWGLGSTHNGMYASAAFSPQHARNMHTGILNMYLPTAAAVPGACTPADAAAPPCPDWLMHLLGACALYCKVCSLSLSGPKDTAAFCTC